MATFTGTAGNNTIRPGNVSAGVIIAGVPSDFSVNDSIFGLDGNDNLNGGLLNDLVDGGNGADTVQGGDGNDTLRGGSVFSITDGVDSFDGGTGDDLIEQIGSGDIALGGAGNDTFNLDEDGVASLNGGTGTDTLFADGFDISGTVITAIEDLANNATLTGAQLVGFTRVGTNSVNFATTYTYVFTNTATIADFTGRIAEANDRYFLRGVDNLAQNDRITFDINATNDVQMQGFEGNDSLRGGRGDDTIFGDEGADLLVGNGGSDELYAGSVSSAADGADTLDGGGGSDLLAQVGAGDVVVAGTGNDFIDLDEAGAITINGGAGVDILRADGLDISTTNIVGVETLWNNASLRGAQLTAFVTVGADSDGYATSYTYIITDGVLADFGGAIADDADTYFLRGVNGAATNNNIQFDSLSTARAVMNGYEGNDRLAGGGGNDQLEGDDGADTLLGGNGADFLYAGSVFSAGDGADSVNGGNGADVIFQIGQGDSVDAGAGNDAVNLDEAGVISLLGGAGIDILVADGLDVSTTNIVGFETLWNNATLRGAQLTAFTTVGADSYGYASSYTYVITDSVLANFGGKIADDADTYFLRGVSGVMTNNNIQFDSATTARAVMNGYEGNDRLAGGGGNDQLDGGDGADTLLGGNGADQIAAGSVFSAGDGADSVNGGGGADIITEIGAGDSVDAGSGNDTVNLDEAGAVNLLGGGGIDILVADGLDISGATVTGFERLWNNATLASSQVAQFTEFGASTRGFGTTYTYTFATATNAVDLTNRISDDFDRFNLSGNAALNNNDTILFGVAASNDVAISGFGGNDSLRGGEGDDTLSGGEGSDTLDGGLGFNSIDGGNGSDTISFASSVLAATVNLGVVGIQVNNASTSSTLVSIENATGSAFNDTITGSGGNNLLAGGGGNDLILGLAGGDQLFGDAGNDTLNGGLGVDQLTGGGGIDSFLFNPNGGSDTVIDYLDGTDRIAVSGFGAAFDTAAEVRAAAFQAVGGVQINLTGTTVLIAGLNLASFTIADIDVI